MADVSEDVKDKVVEKNSSNMQLMDRTRTENIPHENLDNTNNTLHPPNLTPGGQMMPPQVRKKTSSFQITSVTQSRLSHDGGEDSADDLDESHTEDLSSELIDCSKTTDIDNDGASSEDFSASTGANNVDDAQGQGVMIGGVTVCKGNVTIGVPVPILINAALSITTTSSTSVITTVPVNATSEISSVVPVVTNLVVEPSDQQQQWENRFKVVKIVNGEPFKRGRWIIMDYNDPPPPPSVQPPENKAEVTADGAGSGNSSAGSSVQYVSGDIHPSENTTVVHDSNQSNVNAPTQPPVYVNQTQPTPNQQPQTEYSNTNVSQSTSNAQNAVVQSSTLPNVNSQINSVQSLNNPALSHATQPEPPTVIVQESNIVPTDQSNVPQVDDQENVILQSAKQPSHLGLVNQESPVLRPLLDSLPDTLGVSSRLDDVTNGDEAESASGSNTVAIDNKIEQAMDLVKSHLMFAVREEVDVLREKINDLLDKVTQLEYENGILKASASQETLNKIALQQQQQQAANTSQPPSNQNQANQPPTSNVHS